MSSDNAELLREIRALRAEVQRLRDIEAVRRTKYQYWRCFDTADLAGMEEVLHEDVTLSVVAGVYSMKLEGREAYLEMVRQGAHAEMVSHHHGHNGEIDIVSDTEALATWYLYDDLYEFRRNMRLYGTAFYRDRYLKVDGRWRIHYSQFHRIAEFADPLTERPNITYHYLAGHGFKHPGDAPLAPYPKDPDYRHPEGVLPPFLDAK